MRNFSDGDLGAIVRKAREDRGPQPGDVGRAHRRWRARHVEAGKRQDVVDGRAAVPGRGRARVRPARFATGRPVRLGMIISDAERDLLLAARRRDQMETIRLALVLLGVRDA